MKQNLSTKKNPRDSNWKIYKNFRNTANHGIENAKRAYFNKIAQIQAQKTLWKELKTPNISHNNRVGILSQLCNVNKINDYFQVNIPQTCTHLGSYRLLRLQKTLLGKISFQTSEEDELIDAFKIIMHIIHPFVPRIS